MFSGRINVRVTRVSGDRDDYYFDTWLEAYKFMKKVRRMQTSRQAESFEIFFKNEKEKR